MQFTHVEEIKKTEVTILATTHNGAKNFNEWSDALITLKPKVERYFRKHPRPCFATFTLTGIINTPKIFTEDQTTRRRRPKEMDRVED